MIKVKVKYREYVNDTYIATKETKFTLEMDKDAWKNLFYSYQDSIVTMKLLSSDTLIKRTEAGYLFGNSCSGIKYNIQKVTIISEYDFDTHGFMPLSNADNIIYNGA